MARRQRQMCIRDRELREVFLNLNPTIKDQELILEMFNAKKFINANSEDYKEIEFIARKLKKIR